MLCSLPPHYPSDGLVGDTEEQLFYRTPSFGGMFLAHERPRINRSRAEVEPFSSNCSLGGPRSVRLLLAVPQKLTQTFNPFPCLELPAFHNSIRLSDRAVKLFIDTSIIVLDVCVTFISLDH